MRRALDVLWGRLAGDEDKLRVESGLLGADVVPLCVLGVVLQVVRALHVSDVDLVFQFPLAKDLLERTGSVYCHYHCYTDDFVGIAFAEGVQRSASASVRLC